MHNRISVNLNGKYVNGERVNDSIKDLLDTLYGFDEDLRFTLECEENDDGDLLYHCVKDTPIESIEDLIESSGMCPYVTSEDESLEPVDCEITFRPIDKSKKVKMEGYFDYRVKEINPSNINQYWVKIPEEYSDLLNSHPEYGFSCDSEVMLDLYEFLLPYMRQTLFYIEENGKYFQLFLDLMF